MSDAGDPPGAGILGGIEVLDLSWGVAGPMAGMLLADHGARVTRIEPPAGDPFAELSGTRVWLRGKRRATLDLRDAADRDVFLALARRRRRRDRELRAGCRREARDRPRDVARGEPAPDPLLDHRVRRDREARASPRVRRARRGAHRPAVREPRRGRHDDRASRARGDPPRVGRAGRVRDRRAAIRTAVQRRAVDQPRDVLQRFRRDQCRAPRARDHRSGPARAHVDAARRARDNGGHVAARRARRSRRVQLVGLRPARAEGLLQGLRRSLDPPLGGAAALHPQRRRNGRARTRAGTERAT